MRPPRQPTPEEIALWRSVMGETGSSAATTQNPPAMASVMAPPLPKKPAAPAPLVPLDVRGAERLFRPHPKVEASLDLHGMTQDQAHRKVIAFLETQQARGARHVEIVTGKGRDGAGVLRTSLPNWLNMPALRPLISAIAHARPEKGGEGALHVLLRRHRDR